MNEWSIGLDLENPTGDGCNVSQIGICLQSRAYSLVREIDSTQV